MKKEYCENACIYMWKNKKNGKCYIGQTINEKARYNAHINAKDHTLFHNALHKYGLDNFEYSVLEYISGDKKEVTNKLNQLEIEYITKYDTFNNGYNMTTGGQYDIDKELSLEVIHKLIKNHKYQIPWNKGIKKDQYNDYIKINDRTIPKELINDQYILDEFYGGGSKQLNARHFNKVTKIHPEILNYLNNRYKDSESISETLYRIKNNIEVRPVCPVCGNKIKYRKIFTQCCSIKCAAIYSQSKKQDTCNAKYGSPYYVTSDAYKKFCNETYGTDNAAKSDICKKKGKETCIKKYNTETYSQTTEYIIKSKQTYMQHYGVDNPMKSPECKQHYKEASIKKYSVDIPSKSDMVKNHIRDSVRKTFNNKYGVDNIWQLPLYKEEMLKQWKQIYGDNYPNKKYDRKTNNSNLQKKLQIIFNIEKNLSDDSKNKRYKTKKKNHTFKTSKIEEQFKNYLSQNYQNDFEYQYKSDLYPFNCDFYIKSLDLYIEIQGSWTHGGHPYNSKSIEDQNKLNEWMSKNSSYYKNAIETWTIRDVNKRNIAKYNNIKYLEIFSGNIDICIQQFSIFINHLQ